MKIKTDDLGIPIFSNYDLISLVKNNNLSKCHDVLVEESLDIKKFNLFCSNFDIKPLNLYTPLNTTKENLDLVCQNNWLMPEEYFNLDIENFLLNKCKSTLEKERVNLELKSYKKHNMTMLLNYLVYLVKTLKENKILWGVGRGSSVSSYILFLIGIHKIDSLKYNLDFNEFLR